MEKIKLICIENFENNFYKEWFLHEFPDLKKGWVTWVTKGEWKNNKINIHPENNKYCINFPKKYFKVKEKHNKLYKIY